MFHRGNNSLIFRGLYDFHKSLFLAVLLIFTISGSLNAEDPPPYAQHFDPKKGFKPAQANFTKIFLQLAGSLEHYGTPEPYLRHIVSELVRVEAAYKSATGKFGSSRPEYFTDDYLENLITGWNKIAPVLDLESLTRASGRNMRYAINGTWNKSITEVLADEPNLAAAEQADYRKLLEKDYFSRADLPEAEAFYKNIWDKLSDAGKRQISKRTWRGTRDRETRAKEIADEGGTIIIDIFNEHQKKTLAFVNSEIMEKINSENLQEKLTAILKLRQESPDLSGLDISQTEALHYSHFIKGLFLQRFAYVRKNGKTPEQAENTENLMFSMVENLITIAHAEYLTALLASIAK